MYVNSVHTENVVGGKRERNVTTTPSTGVKVSTKSPAKKRGSQSRGGKCKH